VDYTRRLLHSWYIMVITAMAMDSSNNTHVADPQKGEWALPVIWHIHIFLNDAFSNSYIIALKGRMIMTGWINKMLCLIWGNILACVRRDFGKPEQLVCWLRFTLETSWIKSRSAANSNKMSNDTWYTTSKEGNNRKARWHDH